VLNRNNSQDRLEATTDLRDESRLSEPLQTAKPRSCLAVRLARPFQSDDALVTCEICGTTPEQSTCLPLLVSGEVIGSVLVDHNGPLSDRDERRVHESVAYAAPILANLRNLALAEARAATDALTGLPNRRAVQDTLKRMIAHSARTESPLAAVLIDLDHFKQVNDVYGHEEGDAVLAGVGDILTSMVRSSDFVGRTGGEEFIALFPDSDAHSALVVVEKLRAAIEAMTLPRVDRTITASFGIAIHPDVAGDSETLLRLADRALYAAKSGGRNRIELAEAGSPTSEDEQARAREALRR
jgi:diguanylate cyclase (GGDEF)-like protein